MNDLDDCRCLVLNLRMEPSDVASWQQAVCLQVLDKVHVLERYEAEVRSAGNGYECRDPLVIQLPAVVQVKKGYKTHQAGVKFCRRNVYERDGYKCCYCAQRFTKLRQLTFDHVIPRSRWKGPKSKVTSWENIVTACHPCNTRKDDRTPAEAGMKMHYKPYVPDSLRLAPLLVDVDKMPDLWRPYLGELALTG